MPDRFVQRYDVDESSEPVTINKKVGEFENPSKSQRMGHRMKPSCVSASMTQQFSGPEVKTREYHTCSSVRSKSNGRVRSRIDASATNTTTTTTLPSSQDFGVGYGSATTGLPKYSGLLTSDNHGSHRTSDGLHSAIDAISIKQDAMDKSLISKSSKEPWTNALWSDSSSFVQQEHSPKKKSFESFSFLYSGHMGGPIRSTSIPKGKSVQSTTFTEASDESLIGDSSLIPNDIKILREDVHFQRYILTRSSEQWSQPGKSNTKESSVFHGSSQNYFNGSNLAPESQNFPKKVIPRSIICTVDQHDNSFFGVGLKEHAVKSDPFHSKRQPFNFHGHSEIMFSEGVGRSHGISSSPQTSSSVEKGEFLKTQQDRWTGHFRLKVLSEEWDACMQNSVISPSYSSETRLTKLEKLVCGCHLQHVVEEKSKYGLEKEKRYHSPNCLDKTIERPSKCLKIGKYFSTKERTETDLLEAGHVIIESTLPAESKENGFLKILNAYSARGSEFKQNLRTYRNSINVKEAEYHGADLSDIQNSSSISTDVMDTNATSFPSCLTPSKSKKDIGTSENSRQLGATRMLELQHVKVNIDKYGAEGISASPKKSITKTNAEDDEFHYMNKEKTPMSDKKALSMGNGEFGTGAEDLLSQAKMLKNSNTRVPLKDTAGSDPSSRWVKRLKLHTMEPFDLGTKSLKIGDTPSSGQVHKLLTRVLNYSRSNSNSTLAKSIDQHKIDKSIVLLTNGSESPVESLKKSHTWIRRWCHSSQNASHSTITSEGPVLSPRAETQVLCDPENTKAIPDDFEGKHFPSVAAMALMGKAASNFRPCEFRRRGPSIVWNTESFC